MNTIIVRPNNLKLITALNMYFQYRGNENFPNVNYTPTAAEFVITTDKTAAEVEKILKEDHSNVDFNIDVYTGCWQPMLTTKEWEKTDLPSFGVYSTKQAALEDFPNKRILLYTDRDIEDPTFMDKL